jgi:hypothetical protein
MEGMEWRAIYPFRESITIGHIYFRESFMREFIVDAADRRVRTVIPHLEETPGAVPMARFLSLPIPVCQVR